jgi:hypothetical protein
VPSIGNAFIGFMFDNFIDPYISGFDGFNIVVKFNSLLPVDNGGSVV